MTWQTMKNRADEQLNLLFESLEVPSVRLKEAMQYAVLSSGKRLRPILIYLTGDALNIPLEKLDPIACAVECMHAYSLIHDDLPAMDNDDLRRGQPTCHRAFDEATAILAGDALQALAFQTIANHSQLKAWQSLDMIRLLSIACGAEGMVSGQAMDLEYLNLKTEMISEEFIKEIHRLKTGILLETCIQLAFLAMSGEFIKEDKQAWQHFGQHLGLAFQIQDDYLDLYGETDVLGKAQGADLKQGKKTYATLYSQDDLWQLVQDNYQKAFDCLTFLNKRTDNLGQFIDYLSKRNF